MSFYEFVRKIKEKEINRVCIVKSGIFYYCINKDALVLEKYCNLTKICLSVNVCKCGFPLNSLEKYTKVLEKNKINFCVYEDRSNTYSNFFINNTFYEYNKKEYGKVYEYIEGKDIDYNLYNKDCFSCKFYEKEIVVSVDRLTDIVCKYLDEIEKYNRYKQDEK